MGRLRDYWAYLWTGVCCGVVVCLAESVSLAQAGDPAQRGDVWAVEAVLGDIEADTTAIAGSTSNTFTAILALNDLIGFLNTTQLSALENLATLASVQVGMMGLQEGMMSMQTDYLGAIMTSSADTFSQLQIITPYLQYEEKGVAQWVHDGLTDDCGTLLKYGNYSITRWLKDGLHDDNGAYLGQILAFMKDEGDNEAGEMGLPATTWAQGQGEGNEYLSFDPREYDNQVLPAVQVYTPEDLGFVEEDPDIPTATALNPLGNLQLPLIGQDGADGPIVIPWVDVFNKSLPVLLLALAGMLAFGTFVMVVAEFIR